MDLDPKLSNINYAANIIQRAWVDFSAGRLGEAERGCQFALGVKKNSFSALHLMGLIHFQRRNFECAQDAIWRALKINPRSVEALTNFSFVLQAQGKNEEALRYLNNALKLQPTNLLCTE